MNRIPSNYKDFLKEREIPRAVEVPNLSKAEIEKITDIVFIKNNPQKADLLFIFGSKLAGIDWKRIAQMFRDGFFKKILVSGLLGKDYYEKNRPIAHLMQEELLRQGIPKKIILVQDKSNNTLEDVIFGKELLNKNNIFPRSILFVAKSHHSGRALRTLKKFFPESRPFALTFDPEIDGVVVSRKNWWKNAISKARVYGEYLRIKKYSERGDIAKIQIKI